MGKPVLLWEPCYSLGKKNSVGCTKSKDRIPLADLVCFEVQCLLQKVQCLLQSAHLKIFLILAFWWPHFKSAYPFLTTTTNLHQLLVCLLLCFLLLLLLSVYFSCIWQRKFSVESACVSLFPCVTSYGWIHFPSSVLSVLSTSPVVVHSFLRNRNEITWVIVLYTSLRFVEGVYKPQWPCVGWASVTESSLEVCMGIKRTFLDEFPPGHPKMFERTVDIISLFLLAISSTINLFPNFLCCFLWKSQENETISHRLSRFKK